MLRGVAVATFRKRGPRQWQAQIRRKGFATRASAEQWARAIEHELDQGLFQFRVEAESTTLGELLERYLEEITPGKKGALPETARVKALLKHDSAARFAATVRSSDIARYRDERLEKVSPATAKRDLVVLSHVFEVARGEWGIHVSNPVRDITQPYHGRTRDRRLQPGEERQLQVACQEARNPFLLPIVELALESAMRQGELARLQWKHIDLRRRVAILPDTKNGRFREGPLSSKAIDVLRALPRRLNGQVFPGVTTEAVKRAYRRAIR